MLRVGLIGCHGIGQKHIQAFKKLSNARIVAVADAMPAWAQEGARLAGAERWTTDYRDLLQSDSINGVSICTPNHLHSLMTVEAAHRGKHVLVEKPMATSLVDADRMISACDEAGVVLMVGMTQRFYNHHTRIKEAIKSNAIGTPVYARAVFLKGFWTLDWRGWQLDREKSGGHVLHNGVHFFDLINWLMEDTPESVYAQGQKVTSAALQIYDYFSIVIKFKSGRFAHFEVGAANAPRWLGYQSLKILGTEGEAQIRQREHDGRHSAYRDGRETTGLGQSAWL